ncbi:MAG: type II toxin-antitoxin system HicB family antitoxin [Chloroflexota bacterium]|nr:type II toxin-antitoxin system HicB family antitoxin [Chloroflexota bacterium]
MKRILTVSIVREGDWYIAQCLEVDVASQGATTEEALANLREAIELHFDLPTSTVIPDLRSVEVEVDTGMAPPVGRLPILSTR